jgi:hypothetical protein
LPDGVRRNGVEPQNAGADLVPHAAMRRPDCRKVGGNDLRRGGESPPDANAPEQRMMKTIAIALVILLLALIGWVTLQSSDVSIIVNGQKLAGPAKLAAEGWGLLVAVVALFCAAILLTFVFAGIGLLVLGALVLGTLLAVWIAFPFLLPLLIPLLIVWIFVAAVRTRKHG